MLVEGGVELVDLREESCGGKLRKKGLAKQNEQEEVLRFTHGDRRKAGKTWGHAAAAEKWVCSMDAHKPSLRAKNILNGTNPNRRLLKPEL